MNATVSIIVDSRQDVLRLPPSAIQRSGRDTIVEVKQSDGTTQKVTVQTGLTDGQRTEIVSGVDEGATVIVPGAVATSSSSAVAGTGGFGGGGFGGGGGGGGGGGDAAH
jgi:multidrug efflux pump subunit AcrA (membrane-fusion protein)